ncbi:site-specific DNA-methyltransferase [Paenarthrobacter ilicis]|uniref:site-specific DNA-methyltransferase (cytosine-N(4)-specific) n=1 Tax=Paenarthrobacter ilicis TaxID=43665 RepID=A0ABX0TLL0_9MICC|nr:site-specific DNA-methyltransferase [Paenarthrobacter ilicis]MBM7793049.1 site-specific DNA-methyltransferase (cytosine-N4-specific) [Paenarthrobacter ilicis]NIJ03473.1 site-specific DNA-methyltransferase (cytosine-N4-specific) [Paenarthrobacter ilicis]
MMVPELQGALLDDLMAADSSLATVYDPFMGSGTVMLEARYRGLSFHGTDINPMAVLLCDVKANPPSGDDATMALDSVLKDLNEQSEFTLHHFLHIKKWFTEAVILDLSRLRAAIMLQKDLKLRRFLWICLAETVRLVSNSRISTFKLHIYAKEVLEQRRPNAIQMFETVGRSNAKRAGEHWLRLSSSVQADRTPFTTLLRGDVSSDAAAPSSPVDIVMTSPPYGDNHTTVPYGQHSYLPLCWIDSSDLVGDIDKSLFATPSALDTASLGGSRAYRAQRAADLPREYPSMATLLSQISDMPHLESKVVSFVDDYTLALGRISERLRPGGFSLWTLGERRVNGSEMPLVALTKEALEKHGSTHVTTVTRRLKRKRMAVRNRTGATMGTEQILIMQKAVS